MCAIAGVVDFDGINNKHMEWAAETQKQLKNRGPDQEGIHVGNNCALIHTRLAVIDIENGKQPMTFVRGNQSFTIVYNGELYNTDEVRRELIELGYEFTGHSDTEAVLKAYVWGGESWVEKFYGFVACAVWEEHNQRLFVARDRIGVKPFFYTIRNNAFYFASEIKGLLCHDNMPCEIDKTSVNEIMLIGPARTPGYGVFKGVEELPMGFCGYFN